MGLKIHSAPSLRERTTLHLGGTALAEICLNDVRELDALPAELDRLGGTPLMLGKGSNILAADGELPYALVRVPSPGKPEVVTERGDRVTVRAEAGMGLPAFLSWCAGKGLSGAEGLMGVPGKLGGAVAMNAGSYGVCMADLMRRVLVFSPCCGLRWVSRDDVLTGYRFFAPRTFDHWFLVLAAELDMERGTSELIRERMAEHRDTKRRTQPVEAWSAGCTFRNPEGISAGKLLDDAGFRGKKCGGMEFSTKHANFLVNTGAGTSDQAMELIAEAQQTVQRLYGIELELEVKVLS